MSPVSLNGLLFHKFHTTFAKALSKLKHKLLFRNNSKNSNQYITKAILMRLKATRYPSINP